MSIERIFHCDWHECEGHGRSDIDRPPSSFITITETESDPRHFCCWDCVLKFAAEKPPVVTIGLDELA